jgi:hydrogenase 3 maturation protease
MLDALCDDHSNASKSMKKVILGIGNTLRGDDGIGIHTVETLNRYLEELEKGSKQAKFIRVRSELIAVDCGTTPESYTSAIREHNPDRLILVDAVDMGLSPGSYRIIPPEKIGVMCVSTHNMPLSLFVSYVREFCRDVVLIGIQPERMDAGTTLSSAVRSGGEDVANIIIEERLNEIEILKT